MLLLTCANSSLWRHWYCVVNNENLLWNSLKLRQWSNVISWCLFVPLKVLIHCVRLHPIDCCSFFIVLMRSMQLLIVLIISTVPRHFPLDAVFPVSKRNACMGIFVYLTHSKLRYICHWPLCVVCVDTSVNVLSNEFELTIPFALFELRGAWGLTHSMTFWTIHMLT